MDFDPLRDIRIIDDAADVMYRLVAWNRRYPAGVVFNAESMLRMVEEMNDIVDGASKILDRIEAR